MDQEEVRAIIKNGEGQRTEFKKSFSEDNEAIESLCAFVNADGGSVFFGISSNGEKKGVIADKKNIYEHDYSDIAPEADLPHGSRRQAQPSLAKNHNQAQIGGRGPVSSHQGKG